MFLALVYIYQEVVLQQPCAQLLAQGYHSLFRVAIEAMVDLSVVLVT